MTDRIEALGGTLVIHSAPGKGTTVVGELPAKAVPVHGSIQAPHLVLSADPVD